MEELEAPAGEHMDLYIYMSDDIGSSLAVTTCLWLHNEPSRVWSLISAVLRGSSGDGRSGSTGW
jgi:hypothetical protein